MTDRVIPPSHRTVSGSKLIDALGESLTRIKHEDGLTDAELGRYLHKGVDAGKAYRTGYGEMPVTAFLRGCETWNGRFANDALALVGMKLVPLATAVIDGATLSTRVARLMLEISVAMEDGVIDDLEAQRMKRTLVEAGEAIDGVRARA